MKNHRKFSGIAAACFASGAIAACALQRAETAAIAQMAMIGMTKEEVLSCMGTPAATAATAGSEVLSYMSGGGRTDTFQTTSAFVGGYGFGTVSGSTSGSSRYCRVNVVMNGGRVSHIDYTGPTGGFLTEGEQCGYAVNNCARQVSSLTYEFGASHRSPP